MSSGANGRSPISPADGQIDLTGAPLFRIPNVSFLTIRATGSQRMPRSVSQSSGLPSLWWT